LVFFDSFKVSFSNFAQESKVIDASIPQKNHESDIKAFVEEFLLAIGNNDQKK